jgi:hypothetical protein
MSTENTNAPAVDEAQGGADSTDAASGAANSGLDDAEGSATASGSDPSPATTGKPARKPKIAKGQTAVVTYMPGDANYGYGRTYEMTDSEAQALIETGKARLASASEIDAYLAG